MNEFSRSGNQVSAIPLTPQVYIQTFDSIGGIDPGAGSSSPGYSRGGPTRFMRAKLGIANIGDPSAH